MASFLKLELVKSGIDALSALLERYEGGPLPSTSTSTAIATDFPSPAMAPGAAGTGTGSNTSSPKAGGSTDVSRVIGVDFRGEAKVKARQRVAKLMSASLQVRGLAKPIAAALHLNALRPIV